MEAAVDAYVAARERVDAAATARAEAEAEVDLLARRGALELAALQLALAKRARHKARARLNRAVDAFIEPMRPPRNGVHRR